MNPKDSKVKVTFRDVAGCDEAKVRRAVRVWGYQCHPPPAPYGAVCAAMPTLPPTPARSCLGAGCLEQVARAVVLTPPLAHGQTAAAYGGGLGGGGRR